MNRLKHRLHLIIVLLFSTGLLLNFSCCSYSFTGASVPQHLKTIAIPVAEDRSPAAIPGNLRSAHQREHGNERKAAVDSGARIRIHLHGFA